MPEQDSSYLNVEDCLRVITTMEDAGRLRSQDRALINTQFNGGRPYTEAEVEEHQIQVNANFLEGYRVAIDGNTQVNGALLSKDKFFSARCISGPKEKRDEWGRVFTTHIQKPLKRGKCGKKHLYLMKNRNASLVLHGIGVMLWADSWSWLPRFVALDDLLIPTDAPQELSDELCHFGVNMYLTPHELFKMTHGKYVDKGWNIPYVKEILKSIPEATIQFTPDLWNKPEKFVETWKQHSLYLNSDAVRKVKVTFFFYQDEESGKWFRKVVLRESDGAQIAPNDKFLYESKEPFADDIDQILHVQYGDGNVVPPFKFHSVRGLGMMLYSVIELMNRLRCQYIQHVFESLMAIMRIQNPTDRDRPKLLHLHPYAVIEDGISFIPKEERHQVNPELVSGALAENRQLLSETSSSYIQDIDAGTAREQTASEAQIKLQSANKIIGGMLSNIYLQEHFYYEELKRRFLSKTSTDYDITYFRKCCIRDGIPENMLEPENWEIDVEKVFGQGDQTLAVQQVTSILGIVNQLDPTAQMIVRRKYIEAITQNADLANVLVPQKPVESTKGKQAAEDVFATLMLGVPVALREGIEQVDYVSTMLNAMAMTIQRISQGDNVGTPEDVLGLQTVAQDIGLHLNILQQDPLQKEFVTAANKAVGKMMNDVKGFQQRQQQAAEAAAKQQQDAMGAEAQAKIQATVQAAQAKMQTQIQQAQAKMEISTQQAQAKMAMEQAKHQQEMQQAAEKHQAEMTTKMMQAQAQLEIERQKASQSMALSSAESSHKSMLEEKSTDADILQSYKLTDADIEAMGLKTDAEVEAKKKLAEATPKAPPEE